MGFGDLSHRPPPAAWPFVHYFIRDTRNPYWAWWAGQWKIREQPDEPVLGFLWGEMPPVAAKAPDGLPTSKVFRGTGVAILNSTLTDAAGNVQVRFKSSPMGRRSHGHDPHNSFTLNAYGEALLVNNVYRDLYGSPFHAKWCWETLSQNALLVDGVGQAVHSAGPAGRIVASDFRGEVDYIAGEAAAPYQGRLRRYVRHILLLKPDVVLMVDDVESAAPARFQWMLHGLSEFTVDESAQQLRLDRGRAGVLVDYLADVPLKLRQWTGYEPGPDLRYLASIGRADGIPPQWHVEAASGPASDRAWTVTVMRPYRSGTPAKGRVVAQRSPEGLKFSVPGTQVSVELKRAGDPFAVIRKGGARWSFDGAR
jgi:hypothetical protein